MQKERTEEDFWRRVSIPENPNGCWLWTGPTKTYGYGIASYRRRNYRAHRLAYELFYGPFDSGLLVLHLCRNRHCVNPDHLYLGTAQDNANDAINDGTTLKGQKNKASTLGNADVVQIKKMLAAKVPHRTIGGIFKIHKTAISKISRGISWGHI